MRCDCIHIEQLVKQVKQHEQTIAQLVEIIGLTNQIVTELKSRKKEGQSVISTH